MLSHLPYPPRLSLRGWLPPLLCLTMGALSSCKAPRYEPTAKVPKLYYLSSRAAIRSGDTLILKDQKGNRRRGQVFDIKGPLLTSNTLEPEMLAKDLRADLRPRF